jgi:O-antigen ligase
MSQKSRKETERSSSNSVWFLVLGVAAVTIYINTKAFDPFNTPKLIVLILISGWLSGHLINSYRQSRVTNKSSDLTTLLLSVFFLIALLISTLLTDVKIVGFIGESQRRNGFLQYFALTVILLYSSRSINFKYSVRVLKVGIFTGLVLSAYGIMQITGRDFISWNNPYNSMISTVGNPNFASAILAILSLLALFSFFLRQISIYYKLMAIFVIFMSLTAIIKSQSRQGLMVLLFSILFYVAVFIYLSRPKFRIFAVSTSIFISVLAILGMLQKGPLASILYKESVSIRGYYWRAGIEMLQERPFFGIGVDRYGAYFKQFREVGYPLNYGYEISSTNAHNVFIQIFSTSGIIVGILYLLLLFHIFKSGMQLVAHTKDDQLKISLTLLSAWLGFQAQSLISIDSIGVSVWGWLLGGCILGLANSLKNVDQVEISPRKIDSRGNVVSISLFQPVVSFLILIPIGVIAFGLIRLESDSLKVRDLTNATATQNRDAVFTYANSVMNNPIADPFYKYRSALSLYDMGFRGQAKTEIQKLIELDPRNLNYLQGLIVMETSENNLEKVVQARIQISKYDQWNAENYLELIKLYKLSGDLEKANEVKNIIMSFASNTEVAEAAIEVLSQK